MSADTSPAVQEALAYGEHCEMGKASWVILTLGTALDFVEVTEEGTAKVLRAIKLLQEVVRGE